MSLLWRKSSSSSQQPAASSSQQHPAPVSTVLRSSSARAGDGVGYNTLFSEHTHNTVCGDLETELPVSEWSKKGRRISTRKKENRGKKNNRRRNNWTRTTEMCLNEFSCIVNGTARTHGDTEFPITSNDFILFYFFQSVCLWSFFSSPICVSFTANGTSDNQRRATLCGFFIIVHIYVFLLSFFFLFFLLEWERTQMNFSRNTNATLCIRPVLTEILLEPIENGRYSCTTQMRGTTPEQAILLRSMLKAFCWQWWCSSHALYHSAALAAADLFFRIVRRWVRTRETVDI